MADSRDRDSGGAFPVILFRNDGLKDTSTARFHMVEDTRSGLESVAASMVERLYGSQPSATAAIYTMDGVVVDDARFLDPRGRYIVARDGEKPVLVAPPPPKAEEPEQSSEGGPRSVVVSFYMNNLKKVDPLEGIVEVDFQLYLSWVDPKLAGCPVDERPPYDDTMREAGDNRACCWNPEIEVNNNVSLETLWEVYPPQYQGVEEGKVIFGARYRGGVSNDMTLEMFPLDSDFFCINVGPKNLTEDKVVLKIDPKKHGAPSDGLPGDTIKASALTEWDYDVPLVQLGRSGPTGSGNYYSNAAFGVMLHRNFMYYFWKVIVILFFLVVSSWSVFAQDPMDFADRFATALTLFLAAIAFLYVVGESLPKISYLTLLDKTMLVAFLFVFLAGAESFAVFIMASNGDEDGARDVDGWMAVVVPVVYVLVNMAYVFPGLRYRWIIINDKASKAYMEEVKAGTGLKDVKSAAESSADEEKVQAGQQLAQQANPMHAQDRRSSDTSRGAAISNALMRKRSSVIDKLMGVSDDKKALLERERQQRQSQ